MAGEEYSERTCIIVVEVAVRSQRAVMMGVVVDSVSDVIDHLGRRARRPLRISAAEEGSCVQALAKVKGDVKILLNLDTMLGADRSSFAPRELTSVLCRTFLIRWNRWAALPAG